MSMYTEYELQLRAEIRRLRCKAAQLRMALAEKERDATVITVEQMRRGVKLRVSITEHETVFCVHGRPTN